MVNTPVCDRTLFIDVCDKVYRQQALLVFQWHLVERSIAAVSTTVKVQHSKSPRKQLDTWECCESYTQGTEHWAYDTDTLVLNHRLEPLCCNTYKPQSHWLLLVFHLQWYFTQIQLKLLPVEDRYSANNIGLSSTTVTYNRSAKLSNSVK